MVVHGSDSRIATKLRDGELSSLVDRASPDPRLSRAEQEVGPSVFPAQAPTELTVWEEVENKIVFSSRLPRALNGSDSVDVPRVRRKEGSCGMLMVGSPLDFGIIGTHSGLAFEL